MITVYGHIGEVETNSEETELREVRTVYPSDRDNQHSTRSFYVRKLRAQLFCAYILGLYFTGVSLLAQKLHVES